MKKIRIGAGSGYWGAELHQSSRLAAEGNLDYLCFDLLAELTMSLLERIRQKDATKGYVPDVVPQTVANLQHVRDKGLKLISNGGGVNCAGAAAAISAAAAKEGKGGFKLATVSGDDVTGKLDQLIAQGWVFKNLDTGDENFSAIRDRVVSANAYIGADGIIQALHGGADVVIAGRVSDNALYVGPIMKEFGWAYDNEHVDRVAFAIAIGHIIECAELCCGGMTNLWETVPEPWNIGFPIATVSEDGSAEIEKLPGTGGVINGWTIKEHLVYEVHDPRRYLMPDGVADLTSVQLVETGKDRVRISGVRGASRPDTLKVQIGYHDGFIAEGLYIQCGPRVLAKTESAKTLYLNLLRRIGVNPIDIRFDRIGVDALSGNVFEDPPEDSLREVGLRIAVRTRTRQEAIAARAEMLRVTLYGPVGVGWGAPPAVRPVISLWPTLIPRDAVQTDVQLMKV